MSTVTFNFKNLMVICKCTTLYVCAGFYFSVLDPDSCFLISRLTNMVYAALSTPLSLFPSSLFTHCFTRTPISARQRTEPKPTLRCFSRLCSALRLGPQWGGSWRSPWVCTCPSWCAPLDWSLPASPRSPSCLKPCTTPEPAPAWPHLLTHPPPRRRCRPPLRRPPLLLRRRRRRRRPKLRTTHTAAAASTAKKWRLCHRSSMIRSLLMTSRPLRLFPGWCAAQHFKGSVQSCL